MAATVKNAFFWDIRTCRKHLSRQWKRDLEFNNLTILHEYELFYEET
jgi:hypothetical protein